MPNHIQSKLVITGDADIIRKLIDTISTPNEDEGSTRYIDFEKIIPMPEWYKTSESSTESNLSLAVYLYNTDRIDELNRICSFVNTDKLYAIVEGTDEYLKYFNKGEEIYKMYEKYGATSWYDWSCNNWGTKWNAYSTSTGDMDDETTYTIYFQTAWSHPYPVLEKLVSMFPELEFDYKFADEDFSYNTGTGCGSEGVLTMYYPNGGSDEAVQLYIECWDENEDDYYKDENGEWHNRNWEDDYEEENEE